MFAFLHGIIQILGIKKNIGVNLNWKIIQYVTLFPYQCAIMTLDYYKHKCDQDLERTDECYCWPHVNFCIFFWQRFLDILIYWPEIYTTWQHTEGLLFVCDGGRYLALGTVVCWYHCQRSLLSTLLYPPTTLTEMGEKSDIRNHQCG